MTDMKLPLFVVFVAYFNQQYVHINGQSCPASMPTMKSVKSCPQTHDEWSDAANIKQCQKMHSHNCKSFEYHCLMNQKEDDFLEVCAPTWYISGFCAMFNTDEERVIDNFKLDCTNLTKEQSCPSRYISTDAYKYKWCYDHVKKEKTTMPQNTDERDNVAAPGSGDNTGCVAVSVTAAILSVAVLALVVMMILIRKQIIWKHVPNSTYTRDGEKQVLLEEEGGKTTNTDTVEYISNSPTKFNGISDQGQPVNVRNPVAHEKEGRQKEVENPRQPKPVKEGGGRPVDVRNPVAHEKEGRQEEVENPRQAKPVKGGGGLPVNPGNSYALEKEARQQELKDLMQAKHVNEGGDPTDYPSDSDKNKKKHENSNHNGKKDENDAVSLTKVTQDAVTDENKSIAISNPSNYHSVSDNIGKKNENDDKNGEDEDNIEVAIEVTDDLEMETPTKPDEN